MCGFICSISKTADSLNRRLFAEALSSMSRRGPDDSRTKTIGRVMLGHNRLAVIDIQSGSQPMLSKDGRFAIVYNGEIYNHGDLRVKLAQQGHQFTTNSDTEVILQYYQRYGEECVSFFNGMFSFVIYDTLLDLLFVVRDRLGVKPLFYFANESIFTVASSISALKILHSESVSNVNSRALGDVAFYQSSIGLETVYSSLYRFPPGCKLTMPIAQTNNFSIKRYWYPERVSQCHFTLDEAAEQLEQLIDDSVKIRMSSERPIGAYLSGGVDSAIISSSAARQISSALKTYTVSFPDSELDESARARQLANFLQADHTEIALSDNASLPDFVEDLLTWVGEPLVDPSLIPSALCARAASRDLTVVLTGDGPDELWGGYKSFNHATTLNILDRFNLRRVFRSARSLETKIAQLRGKKVEFPRTRLDEVLVAGGDEAALLRRLSLEAFHQVFNGSIRSSLRQELSSEAIAPNPNWDHFTRFSFLQMQMYQQAVVIPKVDYATMYSSLEGRSPFLDYRLVEATLALPEKLKFANGKSKRALKKAFESRLPSNYLELPKKYFTPPVGQWLRGPLKNWMLEHLNSNASNQILNQRETSKLIDAHLNGADHSSLLWTLCCITSWLNRSGLEVEVAE